MKVCTSSTVLILMLAFSSCKISGQNIGGSEYQAMLERMENFESFMEKQWVEKDELETKTEATKGQDWSRLNGGKYEAGGKT